MFLDTCPNQFGFKKGHSTDMCIYVLKEFIEFYRSRNTSVFVTFLDALKAYDKIDHWQLFNKLLNIHIDCFSWTPVPLPKGVIGTVTILSKGVEQCLLNLQYAAF